MLDFHKENNADVTIATMPVPIEEASRFGIVIADDDKRINAFEEKPVHPRSNLASMGIYIFSWPVLKEALLALKDQENCDFGKHVIPYCFEKRQTYVCIRVQRILEGRRYTGLILGGQYGACGPHSGV